MSRSGSFRLLPVRFTSSNLIFGLVLAALLASVGSCGAASDDPDTSFAKVRADMVRYQIAAREVTDARVLEAMKKVERHRFVPRHLWHQAYGDCALPIGWGQTISQPYIVGLMSHLLELEGGERVLEIGTGSGYQAAILGELAGEVYSIEIVDTLGKIARRRLADLGYENVTVIIGDGFAGLENKAPFDAIIVTCAPPEVPPPLLEQLAEGGRLVIPVGDYWQQLLLIEKKDGELIRKEVIPVRFVPMTGEAVDSMQDHR